MSTENNCNDVENNEVTKNARRAFLRDGALAVAGTLAMGIAGRAEEAPTASAASNDVVLKMKQNADLAKVGGSEVIKAGGAEVIVAHTAENEFAACSARCPHKNGLLEYSHEEKQFFCPLHNSRFGLDGKLLRGPAKQPLNSYETDTAAVVSLKPSAS